MRLFIFTLLNPGWIYGTVGHMASSTFFRVDQYFDFITTAADNAASCNNLVQTGINKCRSFQKWLEIMS